METSTVAPARRRIRVYVAGPYTHGDVARNVAAAMRAADALIRADAAPFVPHLSHFQHMAHPQPYEVWTALDFAWLEVCDALLRSVLPPFGPFPRGVHRGEAPFVGLGILPPDDPTWIQQLLRSTPTAPTVPALPTPPALDPPQGPLSQEHVA